MTSNDVKEYIESVLDETYRKSCRHLDSYVQRMLSLCESHVNLNDVSTSHGTLLHAAAKFGLAESAREMLAQGYCNMLLENHSNQPNTWPLVYAVIHNQWSTVKVLLETLSTSQSKTQIRVLLQTIDYKDILQQLSDYRRPWWLCRRFRRGDLQEKLQNEGRLLLLRSVLDTMVKGCEVDPALLFDDETDDITSDPGGGRTVGAAESGDTRHTDQQDGVNVIETEKEKRSLYRLISESDVEELKCHPSFAAIVQHKWKQNYYSVWHGALFGIYIVFIVLFTMASILAAQSSDPRSYTSPRDFVRLFILEITCLLYILVVLVGDSILFIDEVRNCVHSRKMIFDLLIEKIRLYFLFELLRYLSIFLIIVLRIANNPHQWWLVSLAIILCGLRIFHYATVLPFMDKYVGTLILMAKHDLPRLLGVFLVINFSFGTGLYFALVDHYNDDNVDDANNNSTSEVYNLWLTGVQMVIEGSVLTYIGRDGFNTPGQIVYWLFVFCVTVAFAAILIAQFETSFNTLSNRAKMNIVLKKLEIMRKMERFRDVFGCVFRKIPFMTFTHGNETDSEESGVSENLI
ncbi:hypothetical protein GBAR_LOCUS17870 [Geodia barretti]|uniref:Ion transport domain-containing protein n=1 Tax=Geodia barretti TaxID=519541 RepID=A0AA35SK03_GEOBA|nr:hypothetical protein GBAR_LOCUS17870 [Geodia barretti]